MGRRIARYALTAVLSTAAAGVFAAGTAPTTVDLQGLDLHYANQIELADFEAQSGAQLAFSDNPLFADRVASGELPIVTDRLPAEPLVVLPVQSVGSYGGILRGVSGGLESGTSEYCPGGK